MSEMRAPRHMNKSDPAPSRWNYRYQRLMLTPLFRRVLRVGVPFTLALGVGLIYFANEARRDGFNLAVAEMRAEFENRPEFMVKLMAIDGATVELAEDIREICHSIFRCRPLSLIWRRSVRMWQVCRR